MPFFVGNCDNIPIIKRSTQVAIVISYSLKLEPYLYLIKDVVRSGLAATTLVRIARQDGRQRIDDRHIYRLTIFAP